MSSARFWPKAYSLFLYAYHWGLEAARKHLHELGAPEPEMTPFDPSKYEPLKASLIEPPQAGQPTVHFSMEDADEMVTTNSGS
jgi:hypothetical protein